ncbi:MAG: hypothetical protein HY966_05370 [Ignavibacteriales bacterium]|nr:hypothetical protein [Ignavibacteriales bacterium]
MGNNGIRLRVMGFVRGGEYRLICLDTDIVVSASSIEEAKSKMANAIVSYFKAFSTEELEQGLFLRKAPLLYFLLWHMGTIAGRLVYFFSSIANYDPSSHSLKLA